MLIISMKYYYHLNLSLAMFHAYHGVKILIQHNEMKQGIIQYCLDII